MKLAGTLIAVQDMARSKRFYHDVLGLDVVTDFGSNVTLDGGVVLQTLDTWKSFIRTDNVVLPNNAGELYFEADDIDGFRGHLESFEINFVHPLFEHPWGQRVIRFYDPDGHVIDVGERMDAVILRFMKQGLSAEETATRMDVPIDFVQSLLNKP